MTSVDPTAAACPICHGDPDVMPLCSAGHNAPSQTHRFLTAMLRTLGDDIDRDKLIEAFYAGMQALGGAAVIFGTPEEDDVVVEDLTMVTRRMLALRQILR